MSNQYYNFYYDPISNGFDPLTWRSLYGTPYFSGSRLSVGSSTIIHLAQMLRGDFVFSLYLTTPALGDDKQVGLVQYNKNEYAYFRIQNNVLTAETSDGFTAYSVPITWQTNWSSANTEFRIKWEAGLVNFYIGGSLQASIGSTSLLDIPVSTIPGDAMSIFISDYSSNSPILLNYIEAKAIQSYILLTSNSSVIVSNQVEEFDKITVSESVTMLMKIYDVNSLTGVSDNLSITDVVTVVKP